MALFGGAMSLRAGKVLQQIGIPKKSCIAIVDFCLKNNYPFIIDDSWYYYHPETTHEFYSYIDRIVGDFRLKNLEQIMDKEIYKIFILEDTLIDVFSEFLSGTSLAIHHHSKSCSFDILPSGVNKYKGVTPFIEHHPNDVFVFGDDLNDYELFLNFHNSTLLGEHEELEKLAKLKIPHNDNRQQNFADLIDTILLGIE